MNMELKEKVIEEIKKIYDPEIPVNIYELGLIYKIEVKQENKVTVEHPLGSIDCFVETSLSTADNENDFIISCGIYRTSRKIMDGKIYIPQNINDH